MAQGHKSVIVGLIPIRVNEILKIFIYPLWIRGAALRSATWHAMPQKICEMWGAEEFYEERSVLKKVAKFPLPTLLRTA